MTKTSSITGPILFLDTVQDNVLHLSALFIAPKGHPVPGIETDGTTAAPEVIAEYERATVSRARFALPGDRSSSYGWDGARFEVAANRRFTPNQLFDIDTRGRWAMRVSMPGKT